MRGSDYSELRAFAAVVRHGSFTRAAAHLGVSPSALSQTIRALEDRLGQRLLNRTTRSVAPSAAGQALAERLLPVLDDLDGVVDTAFAASGEVSGPLRLDVVRVAMPHLARLVPGFLSRYPRVRLEVASNDALVDIVAQGFDAGIRLAERLEGDMIAVPFGGDLRMICVASPDYLARHSAPLHPRDLAGHDCMVTLTPSTGTPYRWEFEKDGEALRIAVGGPLVSRDTDLRVAATVAGVGIGFFFEDEVRDLVAAGRLMQVLADWTPAFPGAYLYFPSRRNPASPLRAFVDYVRETGRGQTFPEG
ncbi:LysR family transcriptional regulator [Tabrizicola sp.]|uniref:LysR family transcriptional regulator n=1 Tax=Tabrizicola sp. TaxID=2005166 RepID=UPI0027353755|nr:LysR family transcriptional regulator [Tabrizicola sp.]MDP3196050.1 LysR family transcriptional regulator [Tabrizicola sp.]